MLAMHVRQVRDFKSKKERKWSNKYIHKTEPSEQTPTQEADGWSLTLKWLKQLSDYEHTTAKQGKYWGFISEKVHGSKGLKENGRNTPNNRH